MGWSGVAPASDTAAPAPVITSFVANPDVVEVPSSTQLQVTVDRSIGGSPSYQIAIINEDTGATVTVCKPYTYSPRTTCSAAVSTNWSMNKDPQPMRFRAEVVGGNSVARTTVDVRRKEFQIDLVASPSSVEVPGSAQLKATVDRSINDTPYNIEIYDDSTGTKVSNCRKSSTSPTSTCSVSVGTTWAMNKDPQPLRYRAVLRSADDVVSNTAYATVEVTPVYFGVDLAFPDGPSTQPDGSLQWRATASSNRSVSSTPYSIAIESIDGSTRAVCSSGDRCYADLSAGTYRATVEDSTGDSFGRSSWWTLTDEGPAEGTLDDVDLVSLAGLFASPSAICEKLLLWPGTHTMSPPSTLSDQYRTCEAALQAGKGTLAALAAVGLAHEGTRVLSWLHDEAIRDTVADDPDEEPDPTPVPPPPVFWPNEFESDIDQLMSQNPQLTDRRVARTVLRQCYQYVSRTIFDEGECLRLPVFVSGDLDVPEPTAHDRSSILIRPKWVQLNYTSQQAGPRDWYATDPACAERSATIHCHEYPFFSTEQGGGGAVPRPRLKLVAGSQNRSQGGKLASFYRTCGLRTTGQPFLSVPAPSGSNIPTLPLCSGHG